MSVRNSKRHIYCLNIYVFSYIRGVRNQNKYNGMDIPKNVWDKVELQMNLYISTLKKEIEKRLEGL